MADFEIVQPVEGATRVLFDYEAAGDAMDAMVRLRSKLTAQANGRVRPHDAVIVNWDGRFKDEFDGAWELLQLRIGAAVESALTIEGEIYTAIEDANEMQRIFNRNAERTGVR